jgi:hypothetical protein
VRVVGAGRVGTAVAGMLAVSGVGAVDVDDPGLVRPLDTGPGGPDLADVGRGRGEVARERLARASPSTSLAPGAVHLAVLCPPDAAGLERLVELLPAGVAHLAVEVRDTVGVVGPLVLPGRTACLRCLDLTRADRDPDWPVLAAQLTQPARTPPPPTSCSALPWLPRRRDRCSPRSTTAAAPPCSTPPSSWPCRAGGGAVARGPRTPTAGACAPRADPLRAASPRRAHTPGVDHIPRRAVTRSAKLAALPIGVAGRATLGLGKRIGGRPAEVVAAELQARTAEQLFQVLGQLKGGAMKVGQGLSVFEAALPEELAAPTAPRSPACRRPRRRCRPRPSTPCWPSTWARTGAAASRTSTTRPPRRRPSGRSTGRSGRTAGRSP